MKDKYMENVAKCQHDFSGEFEIYSCETPYCTIIETRCKKCFVYKTECGCGYNNGFSGWPLSRIRNNDMKKAFKYKKQEARNDRLV